MDEKTIRKLQAGKTLDKWIHTKVMKENDLSEVPPYSTDLNQAFRLVERFALSVDISFTDIFYIDYEVKWKKELGAPIVRANGSTCAEAICLAALLATDQEG